MKPLAPLLAPFAILAATPGALAASDPPALLPTPAKVTVAGQGFRIDRKTAIVARGEAARNAADRFRDLMAAGGSRLASVQDASTAKVAVRFVESAGMAAEAYRVETGPSGATVTASDASGLLYGAVTLWQLATQRDAAGSVAGVRIEDAPRYGWRGLMLDSARHFQSPDYVRHLLDWMMANKLNRLHWHLVDDQGWRIPIPEYPRLTDISAWRHSATAAGAPELPQTGGFYTHAQIREIVAYAAQRGITIVPEIEMPGHALSAIRAYPELGMGVAIPPGTESDWGVFPWLYNADETTFRFLEDVLDVVMDLFPSDYIHLGGDEAVKDQWEASPRIRDQIKALGLKDAHALQGWFMARLGAYLADHGRRMIGWDEILDAGVPKDATITSWRGVEGAVTAAQSGHDAILSPAPTLYLDNRQGTGPSEPTGRGNLIPLAQVLNFDPEPKQLAPEARKHILGLQANLWTEHVQTEARAAWMTFPRASALAEVGWAGGGKRDVTDFSRQLAPQVARMKPLGLDAADSLWAVNPVVALEDGKLRATITGQTHLPVRYTTDGSVPDAGSPAYAAPLTLQPGQMLRAATFLDGKPLPGGFEAPITAAQALTRSSRQLALCTNSVPLDLIDDYPATERAHFLIDIFNPCWRWDAAPVAEAGRIALDVGQVPFNFQVGKDRDKIKFRAPRSAFGEFEVRDGCEGAVLATLPLEPAAGNSGITRLVAPLDKQKATANLCITYTARGVDPLWAIDRIELIP